MTALIITTLIIGAILTIMGWVAAIRDMVSSSYNRKLQDYALAFFMVCVIVLFLAVAHLVFQGAVDAGLR